ncbi:MAG: hypothetical protein L0312_20195 [Acidobacteria bacterium]|nr:hypothetical protein [Acidobacteriota bacterium]
MADPLKRLQDKEPTEIGLQLQELDALEDKVNLIRGAVDLPKVVFPYPDNPFEKKVFDNPTRCPKCGSDQIDASDYDGHGRELTCKVNCNGCDLEWSEAYTLVGVGIENAEEDSGGPACHSST